MEFARQINADGSSSLLGPDGREVGDADSDRKIFHLLPQLMLDRATSIGFSLDDVRLEIISSVAGALLPDGGIKVRQPYPNSNYLVGGSDGQRNGWCVSAEGLPSEFDVEFRWNLSGKHPNGSGQDWVIRHHLEVRLQAGSNRTHTMCVSNWPHRAGQDAPLYRQPKSFVRQNQFTNRYISGRDTQVIDEDYEGGVFSIRERCEIPSIPYERASSIHAHQVEQLHERKQVAQFSTLHSEHLANGAVSLPASIFLEAIALARAVPYSVKPATDTPDDARMGRLEKHPALVLLCQWWEETRPGAMRAGFLMPLVRAQDDDEYWTGYLEIPNIGIANMAPFAESSAVCGDCVLVQFFASVKHSTFPDGFLDTHLCTGETWTDCSVTRAEVECGEFDEAWTSLEALSGFPSNFPAAYRALKDMAEQG